MEFVTPFHLWRPNETVGTVSNRIDYLHCLPSDFCLRKGWGVEPEDRNVGSVLWVSVSPFLERPSREINFRKVIGVG